jgi:hypothetical protein
MQYHYVVGYDDETDKWFVEYDTAAPFPDGHIFYPKRAESAEYGWYGWDVPDSDEIEAAIDQKCLNMLGYLVPIWPSPIESGEL